MKIAIVGPGLMPIPPTGWGAVEIVIWNYKTVLESLGHEVLIINDPRIEEIIRLCDHYNPDFVHVQYDDHWPVCDFVKCKNVAITSHYAYLEQADKHYSYRGIFNGFLSIQKARIFALSSGIAKTYIESGFDEKRIKIVPNGVVENLFDFNPSAILDKTICLGKIEHRKGQHLVKDISNIDFVGNVSPGYPYLVPRIGEWNKPTLYKNLTNYSNLVLLSDGEAHPLVCIEALSAGLGLVLSQYATANLDTSKPFINVISESLLDNANFIDYTLQENRKVSRQMRQEIRDYAMSNFSLTKIIKEKYIPYILEAA